jgi:hypothetical protein
MKTSNPKVMVPATGEKAYEIAGHEFSSLWRQVTGNKLSVKKAGKKLPSGDLILIGADSVNQLAFELLKANKIETFKLRYGSDDYQMLTIREGKRKILFLAGGSGRSTIYAVYDFFQKAAGSRYFWDGDRIEKNPGLKIPDMDIAESPRFSYRGLRYFAHRGLHRFQAEHWNFEDWKREIDWIMKKRMNFFMLRTGIDDLFQRAFNLPYPPENGGDPDRIERSFNDRTSPWSLKYRGELRKKVLAYAFERGLLHPADAGTITHWYSHTPSSFYKKFPKFPLANQTSGCYAGEKGAAIWDTDDQRAWDAYWKLTQTAIDEYGKEQSRIFHTIGLAERSFGGDPKENFRIKTSALRKIQQEIKQRYPDAPLMLASWDFWHGWKNEEVREMLKQMDPEKVVMLEYTSDDYDRKVYRDWDLLKKFPWTFGIFHAFASQNEIRNDYDMLAGRVKEIAPDEKCKGFIFWPELSHSDTFLLEYLAENSWNPSDPSRVHAIERFCADRYAAKDRAAMRKIWTDALAITRHTHWHRDSKYLKKYQIPRAAYFHVHAADDQPGRIAFYKMELKRIEPDLRKGKSVIQALAKISANHAKDELWKRDAIDLARSIYTVALTAESNRLAICLSEWRHKKGGEAPVEKSADKIRTLLARLGDLLETSEDFSIYYSMLRLAKDAPLNPHAEQTLKANTECGYCRTQIYELVRYVFPGEMETFLGWVEDRLARGDRSSLKKVLDFREEKKPVVDAFYATPLKQMAPRKTRCTVGEFSAVLSSVADVL